MLFFLEGIHPRATFWLDAADKVIKALAVLVGALWTWMNYVRGRIYKRKLEPGVSGEIFSKDGISYLLIACHLKNVGQSLYTIEQKGTGCEIIALSRNDPTRLSVLEVFKDHGWIEPGEQINQPLLQELPDPKTFSALQLNLRIVSHGIEWNDSSIVTSPDIPYPQPQGRHSLINIEVGGRPWPPKSSPWYRTLFRN